MLMRLRLRADWWTVLEDVLLTPELLLWLSLVLVKLQRGERLSILTQSLLILPLYQQRGGLDKLTGMLLD